jgi:hypothetical protein
VFTTNVYECKECHYRWHNPLSNAPGMCPRCRLTNEIVFQARKAQIPFSGYIVLKPGRGVEFSTPDGWIEVLIEENERLFVKNEYKALIRPVQKTELGEELWEEMKSIQQHVEKEAQRQGHPIMKMTILPEGMTSEDLETLSQDQKIRPNRAERRRRQR